MNSSQRDPLARVHDRVATTATPPASRVARGTATNEIGDSNIRNNFQSPASTRRNDGQFRHRKAGTDGREDHESLTSGAESWVEIESQPSESSISSIADEIVVTGLRVGYGSTTLATAPPQRHRRLLQQVEAARQVPAAPATPAAPPTPNTPATALATAAAESSQEEYDETESEEDRLMTSSTEHIHVRHAGTPPQPFALLQQQAQARMQQRAAASDGDDEDDDDDGTALGTPAVGPRTFRPQPNAFSHPPHHLQQQQQQQHSSMPSPAHQHVASSSYGRPASATARTSSRAGSRASRGSGSPHFLGSTYPPSHEDNDAALRASLTTLLSCAAAARGLSKKETSSSGGAYGESSAVPSAGLRPSNQPMGLRLAPESELMADASPVSRSHLAFQTPPRPAAMPPAHRSGIRQSGRSGNARGTSSSRNSAVSAVSSLNKSKRAAKRKRSSAAVYGEGSVTTYLTPTVLTWVVSAGVVVLVSVVGFGAGYVLGREVGKQEAVSSVSSAGALGGSAASSAASNATTSCGHEILRSSTGSTLRRFQWGTSMAKSVAA